MKSLHCSLCAIAALLAFAVSLPSAARPKIELHQRVVALDLVPGAQRGSITQRLHTGTLATTGATVYFVISDASDKKFARRFGAIRADSLEEAADAAIEDAIFKDGEWTFFQGAGRVAHFNPVSGQVVGPIANPEYSPLKRIRWRGKTVIVNLPFVRWGDGPGQQILEDAGGCDPLIRRNPPSPMFVGDGPPGCHPGENPISRYKGAQALEVDLKNLTVTMKLHVSSARHNVLSYYTVFEASKGPPAGFMGVPHAPRMAALGRYGTSDAVGRVYQFGNGFAQPDGGPNRFQPGNTSYTGGQSGKYSPMWDIGFVFFDCDGDGRFFRPGRNVGEGGKPVPGSGVPGFDPQSPAKFDPFQMDDKGAHCPSVVRRVLDKNPYVDSVKAVEKLVKRGIVVETEAPPGLRDDSPMQPPLIVNCPAPVTVKR